MIGRMLRIFEFRRFVLQRNVLYGGNIPVCNSYGYGTNRNLRTQRRDNALLTNFKVPAVPLAKFQCLDEAKSLLKRGQELLEQKKAHAAAACMINAAILAVDTVAEKLEVRFTSNDEEDIMRSRAGFLMVCDKSLNKAGTYPFKDWLFALWRTPTWYDIKKGLILFLKSPDTLKPQISVIQHL